MEWLVICDSTLCCYVTLLLSSYVKGFFTLPASSFALPPAGTGFWWSSPVRESLLTFPTCVYPLSLQLAGVERLVEEGAAAPAAVREASAAVSGSPGGEASQQAADGAADSREVSGSLGGNGSQQGGDAAPGSRAPFGTLAAKAADPAAASEEGAADSHSSASSQEALPHSSTTNGGAAQIGPPQPSDHIGGSQTEEAAASQRPSQQPGSTDAALPDSRADAAGGAQDGAAAGGATPSAQALDSGEQKTASPAGPADSLFRSQNGAAAAGDSPGSLPDSRPPNVRQRPATSPAAEGDTEADADPGSAMSSLSFYDGQATPFALVRPPHLVETSTCCPFGHP